MSERHDTKLNACFGRVDLIDTKHFTFPRSSGLPWNYYHPSPDKTMFVLSTFVAACVVLCVTAFYLGVL
jgi:hypothetical protein